MPPVNRLDLCVLYSQGILCSISPYLPLRRHGAACFRPYESDQGRAGRPGVSGIARRTLLLLRIPEASNNAGLDIFREQRSTFLCHVHGQAVVPANGNLGLVTFTPVAK
jgi:hypothetical protein